MGRTAVPENSAGRIHLGPAGDAGGRLREGQPGILQQVRHPEEAALARGVGEELAQGDLAGGTLELGQPSADGLVKRQEPLVHDRHDQGRRHPLRRRSHGQARIRRQVAAVQAVEKGPFPINKKRDPRGAPGEDGVEARFEALRRGRRQGGPGEDAQGQEGCKEQGFRQLVKSP